MATAAEKIGEYLSRERLAASRMVTTLVILGLADIGEIIIVYQKMLEAHIGKRESKES